MQKHICSLQISRICGAHASLSEEHLVALYTAFSLHYEHGMSAFGAGLLPTDMSLSYPYALLAGELGLLINRRAEKLIRFLVH
jgi:N-terminal acetyltransferase B complex non-catalytic subunit